jgi:hypothetical protein
LGALRGFTFAALDCLYPLDFLAAFRAFLADFFMAFARLVAGVCLACTLAVKPNVNASASANARNLMPSILLRQAGKGQIHL